MHRPSPVTSRKQDLAAIPRHSALLSNLGILHKSNSADLHSAALHASLRAGKNTHGTEGVPANPKATTSRSTGSAETGVSEPARRRAEEQDRADEAAYERRRRAKLGNANNSDGQGYDDPIDDEDDTLAKAQRAYARRQPNFGAFIKLKLSLHETMAKAVGTEHGQSFEERYGVAAHVAATPAPVRAKAASIGKPAATKTVAPSIASIRKSLAGSARALGNTALAKSLEAGTGTDSATLTGGSAMRKQSLSKRVASTTVGGDPQPTADQILKAASAALYAGQITGRDAADIERHVNTTGKCPEPLLKKLRGEEPDAPSAPRLLTASQVEAACLKGMKSGAISGAEGMHCNMAIAMGHPIDDGIMKKLRALHSSK